MAAASQTERLVLEASTPWSLSRWCYWLGENRYWWSWYLDVTGEVLLWTLLVEEDPVPTGAGEWLVRAAGLRLDGDGGHPPARRLSFRGWRM